jgi:hypothetical protein
MIIDAIRNAFKRKKAKGEFEVVVIDGLTREESELCKTNVKVRTYGLCPKTGDLMQVVRHCFGGSGSFYTPARVVRYNRTGLPKVYIDMTDWEIPHVRGIDNLYWHFKSPIECTTEEQKRLQEAERQLQRQGIDYEVVLVDSERMPFAIKRMSASREPLALWDYQPGMSPFPECLNADSLFGEIGGLSRDKIIVDAVLHPLIGLPIVLVREGKGRTILDSQTRSED